MIFRINSKNGKRFARYIWIGQSTSFYDRSYTIALQNELKLFRFVKFLEEKKALPCFLIQIQVVLWN